FHGPLKQAMLDAAKPYCLRLLGPNCIGLMLPEKGLNASFSHIAAPKGDLAFLSQSGALITGILDWAASRNVGFSHVVSLGDMADVDFGDMLDYLAGDSESRAILLYMEALTGARKFMSAARRAARAKPVIVIKSGRHAAGAKAASSHTGALAGLDAAYDAAFRRAGLLRVYELDDLFNAAEVLSRLPRVSGERLTIVTNGGGAGVLAADRVADLDGRLADMTGDTIAKLDAVLPATWSKANPIDIIGDATPDRYAAAVDAALADTATDAVLAINCPTAISSNTAAADAVIAAYAARKGSGARVKPLLTTWLGDDGAKDARARFANAGIATFDTPSSAVEGFMFLVAHARAQKQLMRSPPSRPAGHQPDRARAQAVVSRALAAGRTMLSELEAKEVLASYRIATVPTVFSATPDAVAAAAHGILAEHDAVVVKILSDDISHKSDVGGVALNLDSAGAAKLAAERMLTRLAKSHPNADIAGFTVQAMVRRQRAHELIVGVSEDRTFGPLVMFGAGGTAVEVVRDTCLALPPLDLKLAEDLIAMTRIARLLKGYRDTPAADVDAIADTLVKVSRLVADLDEVAELDINPLIADDRGVIALDARIRIADRRAAPRQPMALRPYPSEWERLISLDRLGPVLIRPIRPEDEHLYARFFQNVTPADSRMRFFTTMKALSRDMLARLTQVDYAREIAFVALSDAGELLGVVRFNADPDYEHAEFGVLVRSDLKGHGLGRRLMQHLIAYGRAEGLKRITGYVLAENTGMLALAEQLGFVSRTADEDPGLREVKLELTA
ncbi:MAG: GNAT family N-acetyltransferase, partial [Hyphomicrobiaceae bacterium]